jgi:hypothetical protein
MRHGLVLLALALAAGAPAVAGAAEPARGTVVRVDPGSRIVVLEDGRVLNVPADATLSIDGRPVVLENLQPGTVVSITAAPPAAVAPYRQVVRGTITDVDADGEITVKTPDGDEFEVRVPDTVARGLRNGDVVTMELTFQPASEPSALPRR